MQLRRIAVPVALTVLSSFAFAGGLSASYGIYYPTSRTVRDLLGDQWRSYGISPGLSSGGQRGISTDVNIISRSRAGNELLLATFSAGFGQTYPQGRNADVVPYAALRVSGTYADYELGFGGGLDRSKFLLGWNAEVGITFSERLTLAARYDAFQKADGLSFNGFSVQAMYTVVKF